ncbi:MAG: redoxin domain-containing (seleno)protein, partial [Actinomycetota bacterium]|nr:redoxin domain-containing (seleno)protein [Actinomycetota bacterium]
MQDELGDTGFTVIAVAIDEDVDALKELAKEVSYPVLVDADHHLTELYAISNVPTVVWVDEEDQIVRPNAAEVGTDTFSEFTGVHCEGHLELVRAWVG